MNRLLAGLGYLCYPLMLPILLVAAVVLTIAAVAAPDGTGDA